MNTSIATKLLLLSIFFCSCSRISLNPTLTFMEVGEDVAMRTGYNVHWRNQAEDVRQITHFIEQVAGQELSLDHVIQIALLNNKRLQSIYDELGIAQAELVQATLFKNPVLNFSLRYPQGFSTDKIIDAGVVQNVLDILLMPLKRKVAQTKLEIVKNQVVGEVLEVIAAAKIAFYSLQAVEETLCLRRQVQEAAEAAYDAAKRFRKAGNITNLSLNIERFLYEESKIEVANSELELVEAREKLNVMMGLWGLQTEWKIAKQFEKIPEEIGENKEIENHVIANSLDLQTARKRIYATAKKIGIDTAEMIFPEVGVGVDSEREAQGSWSFGPQFITAIPLFDFGQARAAAGRAELHKLCNEYTALAVELRSVARSASFKLWNSQRQNRFFEELLIPLAEEATSEAVLQYNAMQLGVFDILQAKQREIKTREKAVQTYRDYWIAHSELELLLRGRKITSK